MTDGSKLGRALQEAALSNINEDIHEICINLEKITKEIPVEVSNQLLSLKEDISSLSLALKDVPDQFDLDFSRKINRVLEIAADIESHTKQYKKSLVIDLELVLANYVEKINQQLSKKINDSFIIKSSSFHLTVVISAVFGGLIGASSIAVIFYFMMIQS